MSAPNFRFELGDTVLFTAKTERGTIAARAEHLGNQIKYLIQRAGGATWINDSALEPIPPASAEETEGDGA